MIIDYFRIAFNNLKRRKLRSWLTMLGIFIGVAAVVSLISLGDGLRTAVSSQFGVSTTEVITVQAGGLTGAGPPGTGVLNPLIEDDVEAIQRLSDVELAISRILPQGKLEFNDITGFGYAISMPDGEARDFAYEALELEAEVGRLLKDGDTNKAVLGYNFYTETNDFKKKIVPGDTIILMDKKFDIVGIAKKKGSFIFDNIVHINDKTLRDLTDYGDKVDIIAVKVKSKDVIDKAKEDIEKLLRKSRDVKEGEEDFEVSTPDAALSTVNSVLSGVQIFIAMVASISIIVGIIGIVNTMTTSVLERRSQIGIMKAIGARNSDIFYQFFIESGLMGLIGGGVGVVVGVFVGFVGTVGINNFVGAATKPGINLILILGTLMGSFMVGAIAGIVPALNAARQHPVDALRG